MRILCWNRDTEFGWPLDDYLQAKAQIARSGAAYKGSWTVDRQKDIKIGETVFLLVQGSKHMRGIVGRGIITRRPFVASHWEFPGKTANYVGVAWQALCDPDVPLAASELAKISNVNWKTGFRSSGNRIPVDAEVLLEEMWEDHHAVADVAGRQPHEWLASHTDTQLEYAGHLWPFLVDLASRGETSTYAAIAAKSAVPLRWIGRGLGPIQDFCDSKRLPPLTVQVVNGQTGLPGEGSRYRDSFERQLKRVHLFDWRSVANPFSDESELLEELVLRDIARKPISPARKTQLIQARVGQGDFRRQVMSLRGFCVVTGITDARVLIASHIRPWAKCETDEQRLDPDNGLMLTPDVDKLFDSGLMTFENNGLVRVSNQLDTATLNALGINLPLRVKPFPKAQHKYLKYHREKEFEKKQRRT